MSASEEHDDAFGFGALSSAAKEKIKQIRPQVPATTPAELSRIDALADNAGFVSRESAPPAPYEYRQGRAQRVEPRIPLNMRVPVTLGGAFQRFCDENRYSYPEGLAEVMKRAGLPLS